MTKAQRILELYDRALGMMPKRKIPRFVAAEVGTTDSYVRTVARQRMGRGRSEADCRYMSSPLGKAKTKRYEDRRRDRYSSDPAFRQHERARRTRWRAKRRAEARA